MLYSGAVLAVVGIFLVASMPIHWLARLLLAVAWTVFCAVEWRRVRRGFSACQRLCLMADGTAMRQDPDGHWDAVRVLSGSIILRHAGWLVLELADGHRAVQPVRGHCRESNDWRRLQVIWRHVGATR
ncbi:MAG: hypothetical protein HKN64_00600 [Woeseiaceae bacterium]|nr:hypothetical protein [Woeseiaceae bacterium]